MAQHAGPAFVQAEPFRKQRRGLTQRNAQVPAGVGRQQPGSRANVRAGQFQVAAALAGAVAIQATHDMAAIAMDLNLWFRDVHLDVIVVLARGFQVAALAVRARFRNHVVLVRDFRRLGRRAKEPAVAALALLAAIGRLLAWRRVGLGAVVLIAAAKFFFQLRDPRIALCQRLAQLHNLPLQGRQALQ